ncbi:MAG: EF-P lysine aminoacylase GenX, partial [Xanthomonadales bacterium]|nr:EF-P lysine aminoacylase GenX [Xanthomonadales bacterium]
QEGIESRVLEKQLAERNAPDRPVVEGAPAAGTNQLDDLVGQVIQPALPGECFTIVHDFLPEQAALARIRPGDPPVAERFEVYLSQSELANGYRELTDANEQRARFERENRLREARGMTVAPLDSRLLEALRHGLPECSGVALGVDRLLMAVTRLDRIDAVLSFGSGRS